MSETETLAAKTVIATLKLNSFASSEVESKRKFEKAEVDSVQNDCESEQKTKTITTKKKVEFKIEEPEVIIANVDKTEQETQSQIQSTDQDMDNRKTDPQNVIQPSIEPKKKPKRKVKPDIPVKVKTAKLENETKTKVDSINVENRSKPKLKKAAKSKTTTKPFITPEVNSDLKVGGKLEVNSTVKQEIKPDLKPEVQPELKSTVEKDRPDIQPEVQSKDKAEVKPKVNSKVKLDDKPEAKFEGKPKALLKAKPEVKQKVKPKVKLVSNPEGIPEVKPKVKSEVKLDVKPVKKLEGKPEALPEAKPEVKLEDKPEVISRSKPEVVPEVEQEVKSDVKPKNRSNIDGPKAQIRQQKPKIKPKIKPAGKPEDKTQSQSDTKDDIEVKGEISAQKLNTEDKVPKESPTKTEQKEQSKDLSLVNQTNKVKSKAPTEVETEIKSNQSQIVVQNPITNVPDSQHPIQNKDSKKDKKPKKKGLFGGLFKSQNKNTKQESTGTSEAKENNLGKKERKRIEKEKQKAEKLEAKKRKKLEKEQKKIKKNDQKANNESQTNVSQKNVKIPKQESQNIDDIKSTDSSKIPSKPPRTPSSIKRQKEREAKSDNEVKIEKDSESKLNAVSKVQKVVESKKLEKPKLSESNNDSSSISRSELKVKEEQKPQVDPLPVVDSKLIGDSKPEVAFEPEVDFKSEVNLKPNSERNIEMEVNESMNIEDMPDLNEIPGETSSIESALENDVEKINPKSKSKETTDVELKVNSVVEETVDIEAISTSSKDSGNKQPHVDSEPKADPKPDVNSESEVDSKSEPVSTLEIDLTPEVDLKPEVGGKSEGSSLPEVDSTPVAMDAIEKQSKNVPDNEKPRKQSFSSVDSDDGSLFDFSDDEDIETAIKLNLTQKSPKAALNVSTSDTFQDEPKFELTDENREHTPEREERQPENQISHDEISIDSYVEDIPDFNEVPEEKPVGKKDEDTLDDISLRRTEGAFLVQPDENLILNHPPGSGKTNEKVPADENYSGAKIIETLSGADDDSFIGSDVSDYDENIRFSDEEDDVDIPSRYSQDQVITPRNLSSYNSDENGQDEHHDTFNPILNESQPEFRFSDGPRLRKITECTEASTPRVSRDNLDDVLEQDLEIEELQVVDEDGDDVFSIEEVKIKDINEFHRPEDDSEDSEGGDLFSLSSELSIGDDFEVEILNQPEEVEMKDLDEAKDTQKPDFNDFIEEILDKVFEKLESKDLVDEGFESSKSLCSIGEISTKKPKSYDFGYLDEKSVEAIKQDCSSKEFDEGIFCSLEPLSVNDEEAYVAQLSDFCIFESDQERFISATNTNVQIYE